jgi:putative two-component system response regulator
MTDTFDDASQARTPRLLVVDDDERVRSTHARMVRAFGFEVETASDGIEALAKLAMDIDLVLLDAEMPGMDGFEVARRIREDPQHTYLPIVMVTGRAGREDHRRAIEVGINDFVLKPVDAAEVRLRTRWLLDLKRAYDRLSEHGRELERTVERRTAALRVALEEVTRAKRLTYDAHLDTIRRLMIAAEYKDKDTAGHVERIGTYARMVAGELGLSPGTVETIQHAAPMHDIGKLGVPESILLKPAELDEREWVLMRAHTTLGARILAGSPSPVIQMGETIALSHHERWDGTGYPNGIAGDAIPLEGRVCAVVDVFDALTMDRPYRRAVPADQVVEMMKASSGAHFDPEVLEAFLGVLDDIVEIRARPLQSRGVEGSAQA